MEGVEEGQEVDSVEGQEVEGIEFELGITIILFFGIIENLTCIYIVSAADTIMFRDTYWRVATEITRIFEQTRAHPRLGSRRSQSIA